MIYGLQFPWTEEMLLSPKFGAEWLTQAMHVAGTLPKERVVFEGWLVEMMSLELVGGSLFQHTDLQNKTWQPLATGFKLGILS